MSTGAERVVTLKMEIPGSMPPLIEEMLEDLQNLEKHQKSGTTQHTHPVSSQHMNSADFPLWSCSKNFSFLRGKSLKGAAADQRVTYLSYCPEVRARSADMTPCLKKRFKSHINKYFCKQKSYFKGRCSNALISIFITSENHSVFSLLFLVFTVFIFAWNITWINFTSFSISYSKIANIRNQSLGFIYKFLKLSLYKIKGKCNVFSSIRVSVHNRS